MFDELKFLNSNKTVVFNSPIEGDDCLVRFGNINSSFLHAFLNAYSLKYTSLNDKDKIDFANYISKKMMKNIINICKEDENFLEIFNILCLDLLSEFYNNVVNSEKINDENKIIKKLLDIDVYKLIFDLIPFESKFKKLFIESLKNSNNLSQYKNNILDEINTCLDSLDVLKHVDIKKSEYIKKISVKIINHIIEQSEHNVIKNNMKKFNLDILNSYSINFISEYFDRNIYFIHPKTRLPYNKFDYDYSENKKCILLLSYNNDKYENVGKLLERNSIQREFNSDDIIIEEIQKIFKTLNKSPTRSPVVSPAKSPVVSPARSPVVSPVRSSVVSLERSPVVSPVRSSVVSPERSPLRHPTPVSVSVESSPNLSPKKSKESISKDSSDSSSSDDEYSSDSSS